MVKIDHEYESDIKHLNNHIIKYLKNKDWYFPAEGELLETCLGDAGFSLGLFKADQLIAYQLSFFPGDRKDNLARDLNISNCDYDKVVQFHGSVVHNEHRRNNLALFIREILLTHISSLGYQYCLATCHPDNTPSLKSLTKSNFKIKTLTEKYNGLKRLILLKELFNYNGHEDKTENYYFKNYTRKF